MAGGAPAGRRLCCASVTRAWLLLPPAPQSRTSHRAVSLLPYSMCLRKLVMVHPFPAPLRRKSFQKPLARFTVSLPECPSEGPGAVPLKCHHLELVRPISSLRGWEGASPGGCPAPSLSKLPFPRGKAGGQTQLACPLLPTLSPEVPQPLFQWP